MLIAAFAVLVLIAESIYFGLSLVRPSFEFYWWRAPLQVLPLGVFNFWWAGRVQRRQIRNHVVTCAVRRPGMPSWSKGQAELNPGLFSFMAGAPSRLVVPSAARTTPVDSIDPPQIGRFALRQQTLVLHGPDGDVEVRLAPIDVERVHRELLPDS